MTFTDQEKKLATLALDAAAQKGEIDNGAAMFFRSLRSRSIKIDQLANGSTSGANYEPLYQSERMLTSSLRYRVSQLTDEIAALKGELETAKSMAVTSAPKRGVGNRLTVKEEAMIKKMATWNNYRDEEFINATCYNICKSNSENGVISTLIRKGMCEKGFSDGIRLTEAGASYYQTFLKV